MYPTSPGIRSLPGYELYPEKNPEKIEEYEKAVSLRKIDAYVNAIQEMLLYSSPGYIALLPALEDRISAGEAEKASARMAELK